MAARIMMAKSSDDEDNSLNYVEGDVKLKI